MDVWIAYQDRQEVLLYRWPLAGAVHGPAQYIWGSIEDTFDDMFPEQADEEDSD